MFEYNPPPPPLYDSSVQNGEAHYWETMVNVAIIFECEYNMLPQTLMCVAFVLISIGVSIHKILKLVCGVMGGDLRTL